MIFRVYYFHEIFPLPFLCKTVSHGSLFAGFVSLLEAGRYVAPFLIVILIAIPRNINIFWHEQNGQYACLRTLLIITVATILSANPVYLFSLLLMNYAERFYYPSFVLIYMLSGISLGILFNEIKEAWTGETAKKYVELVGCTLMVLLVLLVNTKFGPDLVGERRYGDRLPVAHVALGKALNDFSSYNLTVASVDAGAIPYFSEWRHIDMFGLNNKFIAEHGVATLEYVKKENPQLVIFISHDGECPRGREWEVPFLEFVQEEQYAKLPPVKLQETYYLISFLDPNIEGFDQIKAAIQRVSEASLKSDESK